MNDASDPKALIYESYRIEGITGEECRSIFVDWALSLPAADPAPHIAALLERYGADHPDHPMTRVLRKGQEAPPAARRRGGRAARVGQG